MGTLYEKAMEGLQRMAAEVRAAADTAALRARACELLVLEVGRQISATEKAIEKIDRIPARIIVVREGVGS